jgi:hypothetical protein
MLRGPRGFIDAASMMTRAWSGVASQRCCTYDCKLSSELTTISALALRVDVVPTARVVMACCAVRRSWICPAKTGIVGVGAGKCVVSPAMPSCTLVARTIRSGKSTGLMLR